MKHFTHTQVPKEQLDISRLIQISKAEMRNIPERKSDMLFEIPISNPTRSDLFRGLFFFDKLEFGLLIMSFYLTKWVFQPLVGLSMISEPLLTFWGIIGLIFFTYRHSSSSIFQYLAHRQLIDKNIRKGKFSMEFRLVGVVISIFLAFGAKHISILLSNLSEYI